MNASNPPVIEKFYEAFSRKDYSSMQALYHDEAIFTDPVFTRLSSAEVKAMWHMLLSSGRDLKVTYHHVTSRENIETCEWHAYYTFSRTGRRVHNIIRAEMEIRDGLIFRHTDDFNFWRWSRQALGLTGLLLGWTQAIRAKVQQTAKHSLSAFMAKTASAK